MFDGLGMDLTWVLVDLCIIVDVFGFGFYTDGRRHVVRLLIKFRMLVYNGTHQFLSISFAFKRFAKLNWESVACDGIAPQHTIDPRTT